MAIAVFYGRIKIVKLLLDEGADPSIPNYEQNSPLHLAIEIQSKIIMDLLIEAGADEYFENREGLTPWEGMARLKQIIY